MRVRLAIFAAAAIIFAPGAGFEQRSSQRPASDIAARMLAPAFDDPQVAAYHAAAVSQRAQKESRRHYRALLALAVLFAAFIFAGTQSRRVRAERLRHRFRRAVFVLRDRGPPKLQLV